MIYLFGFCAFWALVSCTTLTMNPIEKTDSCESSCSDSSNSTDMLPDASSSFVKIRSIPDGHVPNATCNVSGGDIACTCKKGWQADGNKCKDIDECENGNFSCPENKPVCKNTDGGYSCECKSGWTPSPDNTNCMAPPFKYVQVGVGDSFSCGLKANGKVSCFGRYDEYRVTSQTQAPAYRQIAVGAHHVCGTTEHGIVYCWGDDELDHTRVVANPFKPVSKVTAGTTHSCGLTLDGYAYCWGDSDIESKTPNMRFVDIDSGSNHVCGITSDEGNINCWGVGETSQMNISSSDHDGKAFKSISAGDTHSCAILEDNTVYCFGNSEGKEPPADIEFAEVVAGTSSTCGILSDRSIKCWGVNNWQLPEGEFVQIDVGANHICALRTDGTLFCDGNNAHFEASPPKTGFVQLSVSNGEICGLKSDGGIQCLGTLNELKPNDESGFKQISTGSTFACAIKSEGTLACWGEYVPDYPDGEFKKIDIGPADEKHGIRGNDTFVCGIRSDDTLTCWGSYEHSGSDRNYSDISVGSTHICTIVKEDENKKTGRLQCYGNNLDGQTGAVGGNGYRMVASGDRRNCALNQEEGNSVICWGDQSSNQVNPPSNDDIGGKSAGFINVDVAEDYSCGIKKDGLPICWGDDDLVLSTVPSVALVQLSCADDFACGVKTDGTLACWGSITR